MVLNKYDFYDDQCRVKDIKNAVPYKMPMPSSAAVTRMSNLEKKGLLLLTSDLLIGRSAVVIWATKRVFESTVARLVGD